MLPSYLLSQMKDEIPAELDWRRLSELARRIAEWHGAGDEADDLAQDALVVLLQHRLDGRAIRPAVFLAAVVLRIIAVRRRSGVRRTRREGEFARRSCPAGLPAGADAEIRLALRSLSESRQRLARLFSAGWTVREIASCLQLSRSGVHREIWSLRRELAA